VKNLLSPYPDYTSLTSLNPVVCNRFRRLKGPAGAGQEELNLVSTSLAKDQIETLKRPGIEKPIFFLLEILS
jgi:hypothetical protein